MTDGVLQFEMDCTHELVGKKVEMPDVTPEGLGFDLSEDGSSVGVGDVVGSD
jgi:hypothetical protein